MTLAINQRDAKAFYQLRTSVVRGCLCFVSLAGGVLLTGCPHTVRDTSWIRPGIPSCHISVEEDGAFSKTNPLVPDVKLTAETVGFPKHAQLSYNWKSARDLGTFKGTGRKVIFDIREIRIHTLDVSLDIASSDGQSASCFNGVVTNGHETP